MGCFRPAWAADATPVKVGFLFLKRGPDAPDAKSLMAGFDFFFKESGADRPAIELVKKDPGLHDERSWSVSRNWFAGKDVRFL